MMMMTKEAYIKHLISVFAECVESPKDLHTHYSTIFYDIQRWAILDGYLDDEGIAEAVIKGIRKEFTA